LIHELGDVGRGDYTISRALLFVTLNLPSRLYELLPVAALIGTLFAMSQLVANSEYTVMRASGMSLARVAWSVLRVGIPLAAATFLAREYVRTPRPRSWPANTSRRRRSESHRRSARPATPPRESSRSSSRPASGSSRT